MKLEGHIAHRLLKDNELATTIMYKMYDRAITTESFNKSRDILYRLVSVDGQRAYLITDSVGEKLWMLKVKPTRVYDMQKRMTNEVIGQHTSYDWSVFNHITNRKATFIFSSNVVLRVLFDSTNISFCCIKSDNVADKRNVMWTLWYVNKVVPYLSQNFNDSAVQEKIEWAYKTLCFMYLSENEEVIVNAGHKHGTKKSGKIVNDTLYPVTVVTSKWNVTSIRTEGFDVSGHFRLQPTRTGTKMIWIDPFRKHGYVRKAKSETEK